MILALLFACESGTAVVIDVEVADGVAKEYGPDAPGVLVTSANYTSPLAALCGATLEPTTYSFDQGFGCLGDREGQEETISVWIEPMPETWDAEAFCALVPSGYDGVYIPPEVIGDPETALATVPDSSWPQDSVAAVWRRDFSPCGGILDGALSIE